MFYDVLLGLQMSCDLEFQHGRADFLSASRDTKLQLLFH